MSTITEINKLNASDLHSITGLKMSYAQECVELFGSYAPALASFVQSFNELPEVFFDNRQQTELNAHKINTQLRLIYQKARELKKANGQSDDKEVWKLFASNTSHSQESITHTKEVTDGPFSSLAKPVFGSELAKPFTLPQNSTSSTTQMTSPFGLLAANTNAQGTNMPSAFANAFANSKWNTTNNTNSTSSVFSHGSSNISNSTIDKKSSADNANDNTDNTQEKKVVSVFDINNYNSNNNNNNNKVNSNGVKTQTNPFAEIAASKAAPAPSAFGQVKSTLAGTATQYKSVFSAAPSKPSPSTVKPTTPTSAMPQVSTPANILPSILGEPPAPSQSPFAKATSNDTPTTSNVFVLATPINKKNNKNAPETSASTTLPPPPPPPLPPPPYKAATNVLTPITTNKSRFFDHPKDLAAALPLTSSAATATSPPVLSQQNAPIAASTPGTTAIFGFGTALQTNNAAQPNVFGFGQTSTTTTATPTNTEAAFTDGANPQAGGDADAGSNNISATDASLSAKAAAKPVRYCTPTHFTGPFFEMPTFWETEVVERAPLLNLNCGFLESNKDHLRERLLRWVKKAEFYNKPVKYVTIDDDDEKVVRVIIKDADRTFFQPEHRAKLVAFLHAMYHEFKAYGQAMSYLAGLCMLVLNEQETATVIRFVATQYIRGHWAEEAVGFSTNAWVVEYFMQKHFPDVAAHILTLNLWPDTYLQKILTGLCIHMLRFNELFEFLDAFIEGGIKYLIRFCLALVEHFRADILAVHDSKDCGTIYEIMRLDPKVTDQNDVRQILDRVSAIDLGEEGNVIDLIRSQMYESKVEPRLKRAPKAETFEPCAICDKHRPKWWNDDMGAVCDSCKNANPTAKFEKY